MLSSDVARLVTRGRESGRAPPSRRTLQRSTAPPTLEPFVHGLAVHDRRFGYRFADCEPADTLHRDARAGDRTASGRRSMPRARSCTRLVGAPERRHSACAQRVSTRGACYGHARVRVGRRDRCGSAASIAVHELPSQTR